MQQSFSEKYIFQEICIHDLVFDNCLYVSLCPLF